MLSLVWGYRRYFLTCIVFYSCIVMEDIFGRAMKMRRSPYWFVATSISMNSAFTSSSSQRRTERSLASYSFANQLTINRAGRFDERPPLLEARSVRVHIDTGGVKEANKAQRNAMYRVMVAALKRNPFVDITFIGGCWSPWKRPDAQVINLADRRRS